MVVKSRDKDERVWEDTDTKLLTKFEWTVVWSLWRGHHTTSDVEMMSQNEEKEEEVLEEEEKQEEEEAEEEEVTILHGS